MKEANTDYTDRTDRFFIRFLKISRRKPTPKRANTDFTDYTD